MLTAVFADPPNHFLSLRLVKDMDRLTTTVDRDPGVGAVILTGTDGKFISHSEPEQVRLFFEMSAPPLPLRLLRWSIRANNTTLRLPAVRAMTEKRGGDWGSGIVYSALLKRTNLRMHRSTPSTSPRSTGWRSAVDSSSRWRATFAWRPTTTASGSV